MNHDYTYCLDYQDNCPQDCFRAELTAELTRELEAKPYLKPTVSWTRCVFGDDARGNSRQK